jgi:Trypsin-co-occurring domain 2
MWLRDLGGSGVAKESDGIGLADALELLRAELAAAREKAAGTDVQFPIETLTVELKVGVTRSADGRAGFKVPFIEVELGGSTGYNRETLQTVTVVLGSPVDREGRPVKVARATDEVKG